jgi:hypothetical protein
LKQKSSNDGYQNQNVELPVSCALRAGAHSDQRNVNVQDLKDFDIFSEPWIWFKT